MKKLTILFCLIWCMICTIQAKDRVIERPPFIAWSSTSIEIDKIVVSDTATIMYIKAFGRPNNWITIATGSVLKDNNGTLYPIRRGIGITLDKEFQMSNAGEGEFQLVFPPLPSNISSIDFLEGDVDGAFKIWGIQLNEKAFAKFPLPQGAVVPKADKKAVLPEPEFKYGKATLKGKIANYQQGMPKEAQLYLSDPIRWLNFSEKVAINKDGTFQVGTDIITVTPATLVLPFAQIPCLLAPGKESTIIVNTAECTRQQSRLHKDAQPYGKKAYFGGNLADLQQELADNTISCNLVRDPQRFIADLKDKDINGVKEYFLEKRQEVLKQIDKAPISKATKDVLKANTDITTAIGLFMAKEITMRAQVIGQKMTREQALEYYRNTKIEIPTNFYAPLKEFVLNAPANLYAGEYAYGVSVFSAQKELLKETLGTDQGVLFQMIEGYKCYRPMEDFTPLTAQQIAMLETFPTPAYKDMLMALNNELLKKIELNKSKTGYKVNEAENVSNEELFKSIISKYSGHVLLVDFWATWCGPCRTANKEMIPMKEDLKDKDIVYLYITGETSPKGTWENMIPDIHGEHFRVTAEQWKYLMNHFQISGIPTYLIIDKQGNKTFQQTGFPGISKMKEELTKALSL